MFRIPCFRSLSAGLATFAVLVLLASPALAQPGPAAAGPGGILAWAWQSIVELWQGIVAPWGEVEKDGSCMNPDGCPKEASHFPGPGGWSEPLIRLEK